MHGRHGLCSADQRLRVKVTPATPSKGRSPGDPWGPTDLRLSLQLLASIFSHFDFYESVEVKKRCGRDAGQSSLQTLSTGPGRDQRHFLPFG